MKRITARTLPKHTKGEVFEYIAAHLLRQGKKSQVRSQYSGFDCLYHSDSGLMCAAGCLIAKRDYRKGMEATNWNDVISTYGLPIDHSDLISRMQTVHDTYDVKDWVDKLQDVADSYGIAVNVSKLKRSLRK